MTWRQALPLKSRWAAGIVAVMVMLAMFTSFDGRTAAAATAEDRHVSAEDVFRAAFLASGPAADLVPDLRDARNALIADNGLDRAAVAKAEDELLSKLRASDPAFLQRVKDGLVSGNPYVVERTYEYVGKQVTRLAAEQYGISERELEAATNDYLNTVVGPAVAIAAVVVSIVAVVTGIAVVASVTVGQLSGDEVTVMPSTMGQGLQRDQFIATVTKAFANVS